MQVQFYSLACGHPLFPLVFVKDDVFYPMYGFGLFIKYQIADVIMSSCLLNLFYSIGLYVFFWGRGEAPLSCYFMTIAQ